MRPLGWSGHEQFRSCGEDMAVEDTIQPAANTCVLLAPRDAQVGKHVTDAVLAGGWTLERTERAIDAMVLLCTLERDARAQQLPAARHMLIMHGLVASDERAALGRAVRKHLPGVRVHEIEAEAGSAAEAVENPVVARIGRDGQSVMPPASAPARRAAALQDDDGGTGRMSEPKATPTVEVSRDEIAMLLSGGLGDGPSGARAEDRR